MSLEEERIFIESITAEKMLAVAEKVFDSKKINFILVGPYTSELKSQLEGLISQF